MPSRIYSILLLCVALLHSATLWADLSIGYVDTARLMQEAPQVVVVEERLKAEFTPREQQLLSKQEELVQLEKQLKDDQGQLSTTQRRKLEREIRLKVSQLKFEQQEFREDQNLRRNEEIRTLQKVIRAAVIAVGDEKGFDMILTDGVTYASPRIDITNAVLDKLKLNPTTEDAER